MLTRSMFHALCGGLLMLGLAGPALSQTDGLRLDVPVFSSKTSKKTGAVTYKPLKSSAAFEVEVTLYDGPPGGATTPNVIHTETLAVTPKEAAAPFDLAAGLVGAPDKVAGVVSVVLGAQDGVALPSDLLTQDVWFTTKVTTFKKNGTVAQDYEASPAQPLGLRGLTEGQDLQPRSVVLGEGGLTYAQGAGSGKVLVSDGSGKASWMQISTSGIADASVGSAQVADDSLGANDLATDSVTADEIASGVVGSDEILDQSITADDLATNSVTADEIASGAVGSDEILDQSITKTDIAFSTITGSQIEDGTIFGSDIADSSLSGDDIADESIGAADLAPDSVGSSELQPQAVSNEKIAPGAVNSLSIADNSVTGSDIANGTITSADLATDSVGAAQIASGAVANSELAFGAVDSSKVADNSLTSFDLATGSVFSDEIGNGSIQAWDVNAGFGDFTLPHWGFGSSNSNFFSFWDAPQALSDGADIQVALGIRLNDAAPGPASNDWILGCFNTGLTAKFLVAGDGSSFASGPSFTPPGESEMIATRGVAGLEAGAVLMIDVQQPRSVVRSASARSSLVAGIYAPGSGRMTSHRGWIEDADVGAVAEGDGEAMSRTLTLDEMRVRFDEIPMASSGIVLCQVSAENGPIYPGDLLVTAYTAGHAMRDEVPLPGTILGKALGTLESGTGTIEILVTLD